MASKKFVEALEPVVSEGGAVSFSAANVKKASKVAGFPENFGLNVDGQSGAKWVNPMSLVGVLLDVVKQQQKELEELKSKAVIIDNLTAMFGAVLVEQDEQAQPVASEQPVAAEPAPAPASTKAGKA